MRSRAFIAAVVSGVVFSASDSRAQTGLQIPLQFDFLNPGARSLALGSAFAGLADDATAALTNPAGLTILRMPEASVEVRGRRLETRFLAGGRLSGDITGRGLDTISGPVYSDAASTLADLAFVSFVYPRQRWAIAAYRHQLVNVAFELEGEGVFQQIGTTGDAILDTGRQPPIRATRQLQIANYGVSTAFQLGPRFSIGAGLSLYDSSLDTLFTRYLFQAATPGQSSVFNAADFSRETARQTQLGDDQALGANIGIKWSPVTQFTFGAVYRHGPKFDFSITEAETRTGEFQVPAVFTVGVQFRPVDHVGLLVDYSYVRYSNLQEDYIDLQTQFSGKQSQFAIEDGHEAHFGAEYVFPVAGSPAIRAGFWFDPNHSATYRPSPFNDSLDELYTAYLATGEDLWHYTFGGGVSVSRRLELNGAADVSERTTSISGSMVLRF